MNQLMHRVKKRRSLRNVSIHYKQGKFPIGFGLNRVQFSRCHMEFDESDWDSSPERSGSPKKGRRAAAATKADLNAELRDKKEFTEDMGEGSSAPPKPPRRRTGGWADASTKGRRSGITGLEEETSAPDKDDNQTDTMMIPDLDDFQEEEMAAQIAKAPQVAVNRVATYKELDSDLSKHSAFTTLDDIDIKPLLKFLSPESEIKENDVPWTWDNLIADVSSLLNKTEITIEK